MNEYEITYLADPKLSEKAKEELDASVDEAINNLGGEISYSSPTDAPGSRRRVHYPIKKQRVAWMRMEQIRLDPDKIEGLRASIRKNNQILRVAIVQTPRRDEVSAKMLEMVEQPVVAGTSQPVTPKAAKKVTMAEVEEKIEEALDEEVK